MRNILLIGLLLITAIARGQVAVTGVVLDAATQKPVTSAWVQIQETPCATYTNNSGEFMLDCKTTTDEYVVVISAFNYKTTQIQLNRTTDLSKQPLNIALEFESVLLPDIQISDAPAIVWKDADLNVGDIAFVDDKTILLVYDREERWKRQEESKTTLYNGCSLILLDVQEKEIARKRVPEVAIGFYTNFPKDVFLVGRYHQYYISIEDNQMELLQVSDEDFDGSIKPVVAEKGDLLCVSNYEEDFPEFGYSLLSRTDQQYTPVRTIVHEQQMEMFRSEYKYLAPRDKLEAFRFEVNTGIDKEIVAGYMTGYANSIYYEPINAPLFDNKNELHIFDHVHGKIYAHHWDGSPKDSTDINYHQVKRPERWSEEILHDALTGKYYTITSRNGRTFITQINIQTGKTGEKQPLYYPYIDKIRVRNNQVYYIYRPFESSQSRYLYKELVSEP
jgi:hypothetical protein